MQTRNKKNSLNSLLADVSPVKRVFSFAYFERLHTRSDFGVVFKDGLRLESKNIRILAYKRNDERTVKRLGLVTPKRVGASVVRNRIKRKLREIFRTSKHLFVPGLDLIFISKPETVLLCYSDLKKDILDLLRKFNLCTNLE
ncbi:MAG: ribonuclease P protein component [Endomicrobium sp.]|jgi:ribonuclease P protein component|nr:ribonuclease P protein component [Endomicrobium sp.]